MPRMSKEMQDFKRKVLIPALKNNTASGVMTNVKLVSRYLLLFKKIKHSGVKLDLQLQKSTEDYFNQVRYAITHDIPHKQDRKLITAGRQKETVKTEVISSPEAIQFSIKLAEQYFLEETKRLSQTFEDIDKVNEEVNGSVEKRKAIFKSLQEAHEEYDKCHKAYTKVKLGTATFDDEDVIDVLANTSLGSNITDGTAGISRSDSKNETRINSWEQISTMINAKLSVLDKRIINLKKQYESYSLPLRYLQEASRTKESMRSNIFLATRTVQTLVETNKVMKSDNVVESPEVANDGNKVTINVIPVSAI